MNDNKSPLPETIEMRALAHMEKGVDPIEAVKLAFEEENNTIWLCMGVDMKTGQYKRELAKEIQGKLCTSVYNLLRK